MLLTKIIKQVFRSGRESQVGGGFFTSYGWLAGWLVGPVWRVKGMAEWLSTAGRRNGWLCQFEFLPPPLAGRRERALEHVACPNQRPCRGEGGRGSVTSLGLTDWLVGWLVAAFYAFSDREKNFLGRMIVLRCRGLSGLVGPRLGLLRRFVFRLVWK